MLFHMLFMPKYAERKASRMDKSLTRTAVVIVVDKRTLAVRDGRPADDMLAGCTSASCKCPNSSYSSRRSFGATSIEYGLRVCTPGVDW